MVDYKKKKNPILELFALAWRHFDTILLFPTDFMCA